MWSVLKSVPEITFFGTSAEAKPVIADGAYFIEIDTGKSYYRTGGVWTLVSGSGSSSSGSGISFPLALDGQDGEDGFDGPPGIPGVTGPAGADGTIGFDGAPGIDGLDGEDGLDSYIPGPTGATGLTGSTGPAGSPGSIGPPGLDAEEPLEPLMIPGPKGDIGPSIGQSLGQVYSSATKTNIGTSYVDIYTAAFDNENFIKIDFTNITSLRIVFLWDYVGAGTQQVRWVNVADNTQVLYESATFTADQDPGDSGWFAIPAAFVGATVSIEWQGKSTTAADDPVARGYIIYGR